jgi:hypothetical protein
MSGPCEEYHRRAVAEIEAGLHDAKGNFAMIAGPDGDHGGRCQIEIVPIPQVRLDDPPAADQVAALGCRHDDDAKSFGSRTRL